MSDEAKRARFLSQDSGFVALVDGAFADAARRSGPHLFCRRGCTQCCIGAFAIGPADALRLRDGIATLDQQDPERAARVRQRAADSWIRLAPGFPGDPVSGALTLDGSGEPTAAFDGFADDEPCPALDPAFGTCDLYDARPYTCRAFGPPIAVAEGYGACELCFQHATAEEVAAAAIEEPPAGTAQALDRAAIEAGEPSAPTIIAFVLSRP